MCLHWGEDWVWPHHHKAQIGGVLQWCLSFCRFLPSALWSWSLTRVAIRFLLTSLDKALLHQYLSLARRPGLGRVVVVSNVFQLCIMKATWIFETSMKNIFSSRCVAWCNPVSELYRQFFSYLRALFLLWYAFSAVRCFIKTCVPFQIIPIQLNLPQVNFTWSVVKSTSNMNAPELNFNCPR